MYRVTVTCERIARTNWPNALADVAEEFASRKWHKIVDCRWEVDFLVLVADNDYDNDGEALADEFSDIVAAYAPGTPGYRISIRSVASVDGN
jgi:hypothetical protein